MEEGDTVHTENLHFCEGRMRWESVSHTGSGANVLDVSTLAV